MFKRNIMCAAFGFALLSITAPAQANIFGDILGDIESDYDKARKELAVALEAANKSAEFVSGEIAATEKEIVKDANIAVKGIEDAYSDIMHALEGAAIACDKQISNFENKAEGFADKFPRPRQFTAAFNKIPGAEGADSAKICLKATVAGFTCGILPYATKILKSFSVHASNNGKFDHFAKIMKRGQNSNSCKNLGGLDKMLCGIVIGTAEQGKAGMACAAAITEEVLNQHNGSSSGKKSDSGGKSITKDQLKGLCKEAGTMAFAQAANATGLAVVQETGTEKYLDYAKKLRKIISVANKAEKASKAANDKITEVCGSSMKKELATIPVRKTLKPLQKYPGAHLVLMYDKSKPHCLGLGKNYVYVEGCAGTYKQIWSFHNDGSIWNDSQGKDSCLALLNDGWYGWRKCDGGNYQKFDIENGNLKVRSVGKCVVNVQTGLKNVDCPKKVAMPIGHPSENKTEDQLPYGKWFVVDNSVAFLQPTTGSHKMIYAYPQKPFCMGIKDGSDVYLERCTGTDDQKWSLQANGQIKNDAWGKCLNHPDKNRQFTVRQCGDSKNPPAWQKFAVSSRGQIKRTSLFNGQYECAAATDDKDGAYVRAIKCDDDKQSQRWHVLERPSSDG